MEGGGGGGDKRYSEITEEGVVEMNKSVWSDAK